MRDNPIVTNQLLREQDTTLSDFALDSLQLYEKGYSSDKPPMDDPRLYKFLLNHLPESEIFVDLGAGSGGFVEALLQRNSSALIYAVEVAANGCQLIFQRATNLNHPANLLVKQGMATEGTSLLKPTTGCVFVLCRVVGHLDDNLHKSLMKAMIPHLEIGSTLYIADRCWQSVDWDNEWEEFLQKYHAQLPLAVINSAESAAEYLRDLLPSPDWVEVVSKAQHSGKRDAFILRIAEP